MLVTMAVDILLVLSVCVYLKDVKGVQM